MASSERSRRGYPFLFLSWLARSPSQRWRWGYSCSASLETYIYCIYNANIATNVVDIATLEAEERTNIETLSNVRFNLKSKAPYASCPIQELVLTCRLLRTSKSLTIIRSPQINTGKIIVTLLPCSTP